MSILKNNAKTERNGQILRLWAQGWTFQKIGDHFGISNQAVSAIIQRERAKMGPFSRDELIQREITFLDDLRQMALKIAEEPGNPVTSGKDGDVVRDPDTGAVVRSRAEQISAMKEARGTSQDIRRLTGLDQPARQETDATIRYQVVGVDPATLT